VSQVVHRPAVLDHKERDPFRLVLVHQNPDSQDERDCFNHPESDIEQLFISRLRFVVRDVLQDFPHGTIFSRVAILREIMLRGV